MEGLDLSIVIVNYKTPELTCDCVTSIFEHTIDLKFEVIVVDNNSQDESQRVIIEKNPNVIWVQMKDNVGTSRGYNAGVKKAKGAYVLILNSDTVLRDNAIKNSLDFHKSKEKDYKVGLTSCQIKGFDDVIQYNSNTRFPSIKKYLAKHPVLYKLGIRAPKNETVESKLALHQKDHETAWIGIAFGIINRKIFESGKFLFDEDIFMYSDEVEWCYRLKQKGFRHFFTSDYTIYHVNSGSSVTSEWRHGQIFLSELLYFYKIYGRLFYKLIVSALNYFHKQDSSKDYDIERDVMKRYSKRILNDYSPKVSSGKTYLKYEL